MQNEKPFWKSKDSEPLSQQEEGIEKSNTGKKQHPKTIQLNSGITVLNDIYAVSGITTSKIFLKR